MAFLKPDKIEVLNGVTVKQFLLPNHNDYKIDMPTAKRAKTVAITIHNTEAIVPAVGTTMSEQYTRATYYGNMKDVRVHFYVDDVEAWNCMPLDMINWSCADGTANPNSGNNTSIAIEVIGNSAKAEDNAIRLASYLLSKYNLTVNDGLRTHTYWLNVKDGKTGTIDELNVMYNSYKNCPIYIIPHWRTFKDRVQKVFNELSRPSTSGTYTTSTIYRIRKSWNDVASQIGAYTSLENAKANCREGYSVFDNNGNVVYTKTVTNTSTNTITENTNTKYIKITVQEVKSLQTILNYGGAKLTVDGIVGPKTLEAVKKYRIESSDTGNLVCWVQKRLNTIGFNCGFPDGIAGNKTMSAIYSCQKSNNLGQGYLGGSDWEYLLK